MQGLALVTVEANAISLSQVPAVAAAGVADQAGKEQTRRGHRRVGDQSVCLSERQGLRVGWTGLVFVRRCRRGWPLRTVDDGRGGEDVAAVAHGWDEGSLGQTARGIAR